MASCAAGLKNEIQKTETKKALQEKVRKGIKLKVKEQENAED